MPENLISLVNLQVVGPQVIRSTLDARPASDLGCHEDYLVDTGILLQKWLLQVVVGWQLLLQLLLEGHAPWHGPQHAGCHLGRPRIQAVVGHIMSLQAAALIGGRPERGLAAGLRARGHLDALEVVCFCGIIGQEVRQLLAAVDGAADAGPVDTCANLTWSSCIERGLSSGAIPHMARSTAELVPLAYHDLRVGPRRREAGANMPKTPVTLGNGSVRVLSEAHNTQLLLLRPGTGS